MDNFALLVLRKGICEIALFSTFALILYPYLLFSLSVVCDTETMS